MERLELWDPMGDDGLQDTKSGAKRAEKSVVGEKRKRMRGMRGREKKGEG